MFSLRRREKRDAAPAAHRSRWRRVLRTVGRGVGGTLLAVILITLMMGIAGYVRTPVLHAPDGPVVNDVTQLNPVAVAQVIAPTTEAEIVQAVRTNPGPISVGGGRFSMGGQTATEGALQIDMRRYNRILGLKVADRTITVQTGATWRR